MGQTAQFATIWDPTGHYRVGTILENDRMTVARRRGVAMLPIDLRHVHASPPGFFHRSWGDGWVYDNMIAERGCSMVVVADPAYHWMYWAAAVEPIRAGEAMTGQLRLVGNGANGCSSAGISQDVIPPQLQHFPSEPTLIGGRCQVAVAQPGILGLSIYGSVKNARILWSAASVALDSYDIQFWMPMRKS